MFTGIIGDIGTVTETLPAPGGLRLSVRCGSTDFSGVRLGDSIAVNGVCLTVASMAPASRIFTADASHETVGRTNLRHLRPGSRVHLEQALQMGGRLDGHIVTGHVDATGTVSAVQPRGDATDFLIRPPADLLRYIAVKGSIAADGVSLTVNSLDSSGIFRLTIIPHTMRSTCIGSWEPGYEVNLEVDILARYLERLHASREDRGGTGAEGRAQAASGGLTLETLNANGFF